MSDPPTIDLILAPAVCGKTSAVIELLRAPRAGRALALVPSREQQRAFYQRLGNRRLARAVQFYQLSGLVFDRASAPMLLGDQARLELVRAILSRLSDDGRLPVYGAVAHKRGFVAAVAELLADLGDADIAPAIFAAAAATPHHAEQAMVYARYVAFQEQRGLADLPRRLALARDLLMTADEGRSIPKPLDGYELLVVDGFDQFTPIQLSLLAGLARRIPRVAITLTLDERERPAQRRFARTYEDLRRVFEPHLVSLASMIRRESHFSGRAAPLRHLEAHLFDLDEQPQRVAAAGAVTLIEAADREREVRAVLRRVKQLVDAGTPPDQVAVLFRDGAAYTALLREIAEEYGLPLDVAEGLPLDQAPPIAALLSLLRLPLDDYPRRALIEALRSPYLGDRQLTPDDQQSTEDRASVVSRQWSVVGSLLDAVARHKGIVGGLARWHAALDVLAATTADPDDENPPPVTPHEAAALRDALDCFCAWITPPEHTTIAEHVSWVEQRLAALRLDDGPFVARDRQALGCCEKRLRDMAHTATLLEAPALPFRDFFADLADTLASARYRLRAAGGVAAMPALGARGLSFDYVAILGLSEGEFPRPLAEPAIYRRAERRALREERGLPLPAPDPADERTIFYEAVARARRGLILARTRLDESGNPLPRSPYLAPLLELLDGVESVHISAGSVPSWDEAASPQERALALAEIANFRLQIADYQSRTPQSTICNLQSAIREEYPAWDHIVRARAVEAGREGLAAYGPFEGTVDDVAVIAEVARRFGPDHQWSVSEFNDYITCAFRFAAGHVLRVEPRREVEDALDGGRRGQLYHDILARAAEQWRAAGLALRPDDQDAVLAMLDLAAQSVLDAAPERMGFTPSPIWPWERDEMRRRLRAALRGFIQGDKGDWQAFEPAAVEQRFGGRRARPLRVETPDGPTLVQGRIDRVDRRADGALAVVDYKSGSAGRSAKDALEGRDIQLAVYVLAVEQLLAAGAPVEQAAFFQIGSGRRSAELRGQQLRDALAAAQARIAETIAAVRAADFRVRPRDACPDFCAFEAICRRNLEKRRYQ